MKVKRPKNEIKNTRLQTEEPYMPLASVVAVILWSVRYFLAGFLVMIGAIIALRVLS